jgi:putative NIF3 family GTP cyclohydrolase 1 type 2
MKVIDIFEFLKSKGTWVNWNATSDHILFGDPEAEISAIAVGWMPTFPNLKQAADNGCNLFITHEPLYVGCANQFEIFIGGPIRDYREPIQNAIMLEENDVWIQKTNWLKANNMTVLRCHDVWDDFPEIGIHGAWAKWLGFTKTPIAHEKYYEIHDLGTISLEQLTTQLTARVKYLGQPGVMVFGEPNQIVHRIGLGTGAITDYRKMHQMGADVLLITDDGTRQWESAQWSEDSGIPMIMVNHATAEEPGIRTMADYIQKNFPTIPVTPIKRGCLYQWFNA